MIREKREMKKKMKQRDLWSFDSGSIWRQWPGLARPKLQHGLMTRAGQAKLQCGPNNQGWADQNQVPNTLSCSATWLAGVHTLELSVLFPNELTRSWTGGRIYRMSTGTHVAGCGLTPYITPVPRRKYHLLTPVSPGLNTFWLGPGKNCKISSQFTMLYL